MQNSDDQIEPQDQFEPQLDGFPSDARHRHRQSNSRDSLEVLATQFADRVRRGEQPSMDQYLAAYPEHAEGIRELFPMVAACLLYTSPSPRDLWISRMPSSA